MTLRLTTAGESHGPALVAILTGLPAGLVLDRAAIDADLAAASRVTAAARVRRSRQDGVEVLAGLRHGRTLGTPLALVVRNRDHKNWTWGMSPWPPEGEPAGKGTKPVTLPRPGHADLAGRPQVRARRRPQRARARKGAAHRGHRRRGRRREGAARRDRRSRSRGASSTRSSQARIDEARAERDTRRRRRRGAGARACRRGSARSDARRTGSTRGSPPR